METKQTLLVLLGDQQIHGSKRWFAPTLENHMLVFRHELLIIELISSLITPLHAEMPINGNL